MFEIRKVSAISISSFSGAKLEEWKPNGSRQGPTDLADVHIWSRTWNYEVLYGTGEKKGEQNEDTSVEYKKINIGFLIGITVRPQFGERK